MYKYSLLCKAFKVLHLFIYGAFQLQVDAVIILRAVVPAQLKCAVFMLQVTEYKLNFNKHSVALLANVILCCRAKVTRVATSKQCNGTTAKYTKHYQNMYSQSHLLRI